MTESVRGRRPVPATIPPGQEADPVNDELAAIARRCHSGAGDGVELPLQQAGAGVAAGFDAAAVARAVREAQAGAPGYTYAGFSAKVKAAGCAGYMVSFPGRRVLFFGRTAETHVEHFPM